jgi:hypothetical protein
VTCLESDRVCISLHLTAFTNSFQASSKRLDALSDRITDLDRKRIKDKEDILKQITETGHDLQKMLSEFKVEIT